MESNVPCIVCGEGGHRAHKCPTLCDPLKEGFQGNQRGGHDSHDEEMVKPVAPVFPVSRYSKKSKAQYC